MKKMIRILVVDDSVLIRRILADVLTEEPDFEVMVAASGRIALNKISLNPPDVAILDIEMPEMDGLETLKAIRKMHPKLSVIMFSRLTERGAAVTIDAMLLGAKDYVTKPSKAKDANEAKQRIRQELIPKIKAICGQANQMPRKQMLSKARGTLGRIASPLTKATPGQRVGIVAIGVSTGGPDALAQVLSALPARFPVPIVIVQHLPTVFSKYLAERLTAKSAIRVKEAATGDRLKSGMAFLAPGGRHTIIEKNGAIIRIRTHQGPPVNNCRPAVDVLFESVVNIYGAYALGIILTGMGHDGLRGCEQIKRSGGQVVIQDKATSSVWGMPGAVAEAGFADMILPLDKIGKEIIKRVEKC